MTSYRITLKINFIVSINSENEFADPHPPLRGDTPEAAVNRASWVWLEGMKLATETRRSLGVERSFYRTADVEVTEIESQEPGTGSAGFFATKKKRVGQVLPLQ